MTQQFDINLEISKIGESALQSAFEKSEFIVYMPVTQGSHNNDMVCMPISQSVACMADAKTKPAYKYMDITGFNIKHYEKYKMIQTRHKMPFFVGFCDPACGKIYGNYLDELLHSGDYCQIRNFHMNSMLWIGDIPEDLCRKYFMLSRNKYFPVNELDLILPQMEKRFDLVIGYKGLHNPAWGLEDALQRIYEENP